ncbi:uncharacterized protein LACBIDRAFT_318699 [Laccaria bicolor S238N-H82]|uniref:Predicted protein n=1 Tax=Laccaria bicolor (strain S238N-H82 / ATCC MYA-4686) TaxID=486041 RepID=B0D6U7_LACBS|nr:uncharacterized protein LACBIDRAFT_318699 [Laccaria bicolor S238N-H82]EDR09537.1 predicted protein [Laccaria bicolor S238N-H82]|eukprot:XP_001879886.1 predicted protein [Laccaria bicolor S238N-H82]
MPFFAHASGFTVKDSHMSEIGGDYFNIHFAMPAESTERIAKQLLGKGKERDLDNGDAEADGPRKRFREVCEETSDGLMIIPSKDIDLHRQLTSGSNYRIHSAFYGGRVVAVKVFDGPRAKQSWELNLTSAQNFFHSNVPKIVGVSGKNISGSPFIVFCGISGRKMNSLLAKALRNDLNKSVQLSMKTVKGLAAGLSYIESQNPLSIGVVSNLKWEDFDIFAGGSDEPVLSIHIPDTTAHGAHPDPSYRPEDRRDGIEILSELCQKLFSEVNSILYDDCPERELDTDDLFENYSRRHSNVAGDVSGSTEAHASHKTSRREVRWKLDKNANNRSLESIVRRFEDYLDCVWASSADSPLRRITASPHRWVSHRCPEYLREEITLTADASRSVVVAYQHPNQSEICTICGQLVQYPSNPAGIQARRRTKEARFNCVMCYQTFTTNHNLKDHVKIHLGIKDHPCMRCRRDFSTQGILRRHLKTCRAPEHF